MRQSGMAKHSDSAFNEATAVRILSEKLEQNHLIKTFFKENDRTPNYDGTLELIGARDEPKKQFIVQIKKTQALKCISKGKNKGRYRYSLETSFLHYIKKKVAESPAIYFVIDIDNKRIFYVHLSDKILMGMEFEDKQKVQFFFGQENILDSIEDFYSELNTIADERNRKFVYKTEDEIAEMQDAVEYLNTLLDSDLKTIKGHVLPNFWRFGIGVSNSAHIEIGSCSSEKKKDTVFKTEKASLFCLYPQFKGKLDMGVSEFKDDGFYQQVDCMGNQTPKEYIKDILGKIVRTFCQNPPIEILPTIVLYELVYNQALQIHHYFSDDDDLSPSRCLSEVIIMLRYLDYLIFRKPQKETECSLKKRLLKERRKISLFDPFVWNNVRTELNEYYNKHYQEERFSLGKRVFDYIGEEDVQYYCRLNELEKRSNEQIKHVWDYEPIDFMLKGEYLEKDIKPICEEWLGKLPKLYDEVYGYVFGDNPGYRYVKYIEYSIEDNRKRGYALSILGKARVYSSRNGNLEIRYSSPILTDFNEEDKSNGLQHIIAGEMFAGSILASSPTLYYDGIRCFLYQGICERFGLKCEGISINNRQERLFE